MLADQKDEWIRGVICENTFTSISEMADKLFPFLKTIGNLKEKMLRLDWSSHKRISAITKPIFFITGDKDFLVPYEMTANLYQASVKSSDKELWVVKDGEHNNTFLKAGPEYTQRLRSFMNKCLGDSAPTIVEQKPAEEFSVLIKDEETKNEAAQAHEEDVTSKVYPSNGVEEVILEEEPSKKDD